MSDNDRRRPMRLHRSALERVGEAQKA